MFSQCQAIHARSLFPCQDTPDVKSTFTFNIRSPLPVLASGLPTGSRDFLHGEHGNSGTLLYTFHQSIPMPSYLFAIASGDLASASIGPRSTVWTGPEELKASQWEFEDDTESYIQSAEKIIYPYAWTTYNVLVLPPSFPYGMQSPVQRAYPTYEMYMLCTRIALTFLQAVWKTQSSHSPPQLWCRVTDKTLM